VSVRGVPSGAEGKGGVASDSASSFSLTPLMGLSFRTASSREEHAFVGGTYAAGQQQVPRLGR